MQIKRKFGTIIFVAALLVLLITLDFTWRLIFLENNEISFCKDFLRKELSKDIFGEISEIYLLYNQGRWQWSSKNGGTRKTVTLYFSIEASQRDNIVRIKYKKIGRHTDVLRVWSRYGLFKTVEYWPDYQPVNQKPLFSANVYAGFLSWLCGLVAIFFSIGIKKWNWFQRIFRFLFVKPKISTAAFVFVVAASSYCFIDGVLCFMNRSAFL